MMAHHGQSLSFKKRKTISCGAWKFPVKKLTVYREKKCKRKKIRLLITAGILYCILSKVYRKTHMFPLCSVCAPQQKGITNFLFSKKNCGFNHRRTQNKVGHKKRVGSRCFKPELLVKMRPRLVIWPQVVKLWSHPKNKKKAHGRIQIKGKIFQWSFSRAFFSVMWINFEFKAAWPISYSTHSLVVLNDSPLSPFFGFEEKYILKKGKILFSI